MDDSKIIAGLDLSLSRTGIAVLFPGFMSNENLMDGICFEHIVVAKLKNNDIQSRIERIIYISDEIIKILNSYCVTHVAVENYAYGRAGYGRVFDLAELGGHVKCEIFSKMNIIPDILQISTIRKHLMGRCRRNNPKGQVLSFLKRVGIVVNNNDEADAFAVALKLFDDINNNKMPSLSKYWRG